VVQSTVAVPAKWQDRIPGAPGVGPGRAAAIVKRHGSLEAALEAGGFPTIADQLRTYLRIATLQFDAPMSKLPDVAPNWGRAAGLAETWGLGGLSRRLAERA